MHQSRNSKPHASAAMTGLAAALCHQVSDKIASGRLWGNRVLGLPQLYGPFQICCPGRARTL